MATRVLNRDSVALGVAEMNLGLSADHIANTAQALTGANYFGSKTEVTYELSREFRRQAGVSGNILMLLDHLLTRVDFSVSVSFIEINKRTLSFALGGDGSSSDFFEDAVKNPTDLRVEFVFTYPNKVNKMILILPRAQIITDNLSLAFQREDAMESGLTVKACQTDNAAWSDRPLGKVIFI